MSSLVAETVLEVLDERTLDILERRRNAKVGVVRRGWLVRRALLTADIASLIAAFAAAESLYPVQLNRAGSLSEFAEFAFFALSLPAWVVAAKVYGLYAKDEERADHSTADEFAGVFHLITVCSWLLYAVSLTTQWFNPQFGKVFVFWLLSVLLLPVARAFARVICRRQIHYLQNTIIVGAGNVGQTLAQKLLKHPEYGINLVGFVDRDPRERRDGLTHLTLLGSPEQLPELVELLDVERVIYAFSGDPHTESLELIRKLNELDIQVDVVPRFFEVLSPGVDVHTVEGVPMWGLPPARLSRSSHAVKRAVDIAGSAVGIVLCAPLFLAAAVAIKVESRGPVFFRQVRMGSAGPFRIWKFRTMSNDAEERKGELEHLNKHRAPGGDPRMFKIDRDPRVTRVGSYLRRLSLDEVPQLINVLAGEMSLVGPRPLILDEDRYVDGWGHRRLDLKPGITGLWQVLGRDEIGFEEMVRLDYTYVTAWSLMTDIKLMFRTLPVLLDERRRRSARTVTATKVDVNCAD